MRNTGAPGRKNWRPLSGIVGKLILRVIARIQHRTLAVTVDTEHITHRLSMMRSLDVKAILRSSPCCAVLSAGSGALPVDGINARE